MKTQTDRRDPLPSLMANSEPQSRGVDSVCHNPEPDD